MESAQLLYKNGFYSYNGFSSAQMDIVSLFLATDVKDRVSVFREWALSDMHDDSHRFTYSIAGNITLLEKEGRFISLREKLGGESSDEKVQLSVQQFVQLLDDWRDKVCATKSSEVIIKHENDQFVIETKD